jgi:hypothetical protein
VQCFSSGRSLALVGGSDAHSLATVGRGYTLFAGSTADDLYRSILRNQVRCGGRSWSAHHYLEIGWLYMRQRTLRGALRVLSSDGAVPLHR